MKSIMELFKGDAVKFFGIDKKIVSATRTEYSHLNLQKNIDDWILKADDDSYLHFEFQTTNKKQDLPRFMVSDAILCYQEGKPVKTIVVYSSDIEQTNTTLDYGSIQYKVDAFYLVKLDGDKKYDELKAKIEAGTQLTKQDLMSIVFLPLMKNSVDKMTRIEQSVELSTKLYANEEQLQILAMLGLLAEKFIIRPEQLKRLKGLMSVGALAEIIAKDKAVEIAKKLLMRGMSIEAVSADTGLPEATVRDLQVENQ